jgi:hypothetical protein
LLASISIRSYSQPSLKKRLDCWRNICIYHVF